VYAFPPMSDSDESGGKEAKLRGFVAGASEISIVIGLARPNYKFVERGYRAPTPICSPLLPTAISAVAGDPLQLYHQHY
jgi:hypothetical protein